MTIGETMKQKREAAKISLAALQRDIRFISYSFLHDLENNRAVWTPKHEQAYERALKRLSK